MDKRDYLEQNIERLLGSVQPEMKLPEDKKQEILTELARKSSTSYRSDLWRTLAVPNWGKFAAAAVLIIVLLVGAALVWNNLTQQRETAESVSENKIQAISPELVVEETSLPAGFAADEAYESLKAFNFKGLDMSISQSKPNDNMLLEARAAKLKDMGKPKPVDMNIGMSHGPVKDGLAAFLICEQNQFKLDEPVPLLYGIVYNGPDESMAVPAPNPAVDPSNISWFSITGPDGNDVPYMGVYATFPRLSPKDVLRLKRRNFHGRLTPNIRDYFKLCTPGIYTIKWYYQIGSIVGVSCWTGELVSNEIQIEIVK